MFSYNTRILILLLILVVIFLSAGCGSEQSSISIKIGYQGNIEEAPLILAYENKFFKKQGINISLVKMDFEGIQSGISSGEIQGATFDYRVFEAVDNGANIKLVAGLHSGCTQIIVNGDANINNISDLKGKTIGVTKLGNGSMVVTSDLLKTEKIDQSIKWISKDEENLKKLLREREIDAISILENPDPSKRHLYTGEKVLYSSSNKDNKGRTYKHFYESFIGFSGDFVKSNQKIAFNTSVAWLKATQWVNDNQNTAYKLLIDKGYVNGDLNSILNKTEYFMWMPGVKYAKNHIEIYSSQQKNQNILKSGMSEKEFLKKIYEPLIPELNGR